MLGAASSVGDAAPGASRTSGLGRDGPRDQADVRVQVTALAEWFSSFPNWLLIKWLRHLRLRPHHLQCLPCPLQGRRLRQKLATALMFRQYQSQCWEGYTRHLHKRHRQQAQTHHQTLMEMMIPHNVEFAAAAMKTRIAHTSP